MAAVIVYSYAIFDQGKLIRLPSKRTADKIAQIGGKVIWQTAQAVDERDLREDGRYLPKHYEEPSDDDRDAAMKAAE
jgi:hypothetical protein